MSAASAARRRKVRRAKRQAARRLNLVERFILGFFESGRRGVVLSRKAHRVVRRVERS